MSSSFAHFCPSRSSGSVEALRNVALLAALYLFPAGCGSVLTPVMMPVPPGVKIIDEPIMDAALKYGSGPEPVNPAQYAVNPANYRKYHVEEVRSPPHRALMYKGWGGYRWLG